ncbi:MAG: BolA family transcriptional regulator [Betaproteobacteria bacterium]|nr:BolA family transcriptional regulator [Betaproteobacteria bacterium]
MSVLEQIRQCLASLEPQQVEIADDSALHAGHAGAKDGGGHYRLTVISKHFTGLNTMQRHRLVYAALGSLMKSGIHALSINARAPDDA